MSSINSLKKNRDFQRVYSKRQSFANRSLVMYKMSNDRADTRIGISVSKKVGNSVVRHRVTRVIRECCRLHEKELIQGLDIVIVARPLAKEQGLMEIEEAFAAQRRVGAEHLGAAIGGVGMGTHQSSFWTKPLPMLTLCMTDHSVSCHCGACNRTERHNNQDF